MIKLVIFDFDDTLVLNNNACYELENHIAKSLGYPSIDKRVYMETWGQPIAEAVLKRIPNVNTEAFFNLFYDKLGEFVTDEKIDKIPARNLKTLDEIIDLNKSVCILTSREKNEIIHLEKPSFPLFSRIDKIYYKKKDGYKKPDKRVFLEVLDDYQIKPNEAVYIGDSLGDAISAKGAGLSFFATLESGLKNESDFKNLHVDKFIYNLQELIPLLK